MKDFYNLAELSPGKIEHLVTRAKQFEQQGASPLLQGKVLALLFLKPSLRALTSLQATMIRLGGGTFVISPEISIHGLETRSGVVMEGTAAEHIKEAVPVIASYGDAIGIRAVANKDSLEDDLDDRSFRELRSLCDIPVINLESSIRHPCQSLVDWKTLGDFSIPETGASWRFRGCITPKRCHFQSSVARYTWQQCEAWISPC